MSGSHLTLLFGHEQRKHLRIRRQFSVSLYNRDINLCIQGVTANLSQHGALFRVENYHLFRTGTPILITVHLPPEFTGQNKVIGLQGEAVISRIDKANKGVAVEFCIALRQFERVDVPDMLQEANRKRLSTFSGRSSHQGSPGDVKIVPRNRKGPCLGEVLAPAIPAYHRKGTRE